MGKLLSKSEFYKDNYCAKIISVTNLVSHPNADRLQIMNIDGKKIITDMSTKVGDIRILFTLESQLNSDYLSKNNDYRPNLNLNSEPQFNHATNPGTKSGGFFEAKNRIKAIKLRGILSEGYVVPVETLNFMLSEKEIDEIKNSIGEEFDSVRDLLLVQKYVVKESRQQGLGGVKGKKANESKIIPEQFRFHYDTPQLSKNMFKVEPNSFITISDKWHGCIAYDTQIETLEFGYLTIKEIYDQRLECHIKAFDFEKNEVVYVPIDNHYFLADDGEWYEIELEDGRTIKITGNNPVWLPELNCYRKVEDLITDDFLSVEGDKSFISN